MLFQDSGFRQDSLGSGWALGISVEGMRGGRGRHLFHPDLELSFSSSGLLGEERQRGGSD